MAETDLRADIEELEKLAETAVRRKIKDILTVEIRKLQSELSRRLEQGNSEKISQKPEKTETIATTKYTKKLDSYGWDQSDKFMKIYVTLNGVHQIDATNVKSEHSDKSTKLVVSDLGGKNYQLTISNLFEKIVPDSSYHKVKTDMVLLMLKKAEEKKTWAYVTEREQKAKEKPKPDMSKDKDPNESLMDMMKQMYDDGDDDMKRTIAKAWSENQNKSGGDPMAQYTPPQ